MSDLEEMARFMYTKLRSAGPGWDEDDDESTKDICYIAADAAIEWYCTRWSREDEENAEENSD